MRRTAQNEVFAPQVQTVALGREQHDRKPRTRWHQGTQPEEIWRKSAG